MSDYARELRTAAKSWSSAYLQFKTGRNREGYQAYSFVEDDDDKWFYQVALKNVRNICYVSCGGKDNVMAVFRKLKEENASGGQLFFVDRDTESMPYEAEDEVLRTEMYSWESYVCQPEFVGHFLEHRVDPNLGARSVRDVVSAWEETIDNFRGLLSEHAAFCRTALVLKVSLNISEFRIRDPNNASKFALSPNAQGSALPRFYHEAAAEKGAVAKDIARRTQIFLGLDIQKFAQGKIVFSLLKLFVENVIRQIDRKMRGSYNSPLDWVKFMQWDRAELDFIRSYAKRRLHQASPEIAIVSL